MYSTQTKEKALLIMIKNRKEFWPVEVLAEEFRNLVLSTGIEVADLVFVKRDIPTPSLYIGKGKAEELAEIVKNNGINVVIFNENLKFAQQRNLEDVLGTKTIDRTQLILDIFCRHARSQEGILQVELAQLQYLLPRLSGKGIMLSRLGGGIGTRGPGEKKLEIDRRRITDRITRLEKELEQVRMSRGTRRKKREKEKINTCSLVGYTNAGKSTLFNALTESNEQVSPALFTTLDTVSRVVTVHDNSNVVLTDTVGFLYKLPPQLVESFKATLEELHHADLLLHVIDAASTDFQRLRQSVNTVLADLELTSKPMILVFNKIDKINADTLQEIRQEWPDAVFISALEKVKLEELKEKIYLTLYSELIEVILKFPFSRMEIVKDIHKYCEVIKQNYQEDCVVYWVKAKRHLLDFFRNKGIEVKEIDK